MFALTSVGKYIFIHGTPVFFDGKNYSTTDASCRFLYFMAPFCDKVALCAPLKNVEILPENSYILDTEKISVAPLPFFYRTSGFLKGFPTLQFRVIKSLLRHLPDANHVSIRVPDPLAFLSYAVSRRMGKEISIQITGEVRSIIVSKNKGWKRVAADLVGMAHNFVLSIITRNTLTFVWGEQLKKMLPRARNLHETFTSLVPADSIRKIDRTSIRNPVKIFYAGFLQKNKGIDYLIEAVAEAQKSGDFALSIAGCGEEENNLRECAKHFGVENRVKFLGYIAGPDAMFQLLEKNDILVLPSFSEGVPKILLEGMAVGIPIIATNVGGIPKIIKNGRNGLLVNPGSAPELKEAILRVAGDNALRLSLLEGALEFIRGHTAEAVTEDMAMKILRYRTGRG